MRFANRMKTLIQNYANTESTEPLYICESLNDLEGEEANIWTPDGSSAFDAFDTTKPDVFITHFGYLTNDILKYLSQNNNIELLVNVTGATQDVIDQLDDIVDSSGINCPFVFYNSPSAFNTIKQRKTKMINIMLGADIYLSKQSVETPEYKADLAVISNYTVKGRLSDITDGFDVHHFLSTNQELANEVDIVAPTMHLYGLYGKYENILVTQDTQDIPQVLFDSILYGKNVFFLPKYESQKDKMYEVLDSSLKAPLPLIDTDPKEEWEEKALAVKNKVLSSHTCLSRVKRLASKLQNKDLVSKIEKKIKDLQK